MGARKKSRGNRGPVETAVQDTHMCDSPTAPEGTLTGQMSIWMAGDQHLDPETTTSGLGALINWFMPEI